MRYSHTIRYFGALLLLPLLLLASACNHVGQTGEEETDLPFSVSVNSQITIDRWDGAGTKAGETDEWPAGAMLYLLLDNGRTPIQMQYSYYGQDTWTLVYMDYGTTNPVSSMGLNSTSGHCTCIYIENPDGSSLNWCSYQDEDGAYLRLAPGYAIYRDDEAIYSFLDTQSSQVFSLKTHLKPATGRIRFKRGDNTDWLNPNVYGMKHYTRYNLRTGTLVESTQPFYESFAPQNEYSVYYYGTFADPDHKTLTVADGEGINYFYARSFDEDILAPGESNVVTMPTSSNHNEWYEYNTLYGWNLGLDGLTMLYVVPGTFQMGGSDAPPAHKVTLTKGYYISDTEVTEDMWYRVMGDSSYADSDKPVRGKSWEEIQTFLSALSAKTGYPFRLPTEAEWEFAARGGLKSNGYTYSGNDTYSVVATYNVNQARAVKSKEPNEWSLYDMSGNVSEWVSDWYAAYPTTAVVDPTGPATGTIHIRRGGFWSGDYRALSVSYRDIESSISYAGFRLVFDAPTFN